MITQEQINSELDLAKRLYLYYFDNMANLLSVGSDEYLSWYKDLCCLFFISNSIGSVYLVDNVAMIGDTEIDENFFSLLTSSSREYLTYENKDIVYIELDQLGNAKDHSTPTTPTIIVSYQGFNQDWRSSIIDITVDDITQVVLPFQLIDTDPDSIRITVNDNDPIHLVLPAEEGVHIVGDILYWHTYYNLKAGDRVFIQYLANNNAPGIPSSGQYIESTVAVSSVFTDIADWTEMSIIGYGNYYIGTPMYNGYAYLYMSFPNGNDVAIYDELGSNITSSFVFVGSRTLGSGAVNKVWKSKNQYNAATSLNLLIKLS